MPVYTYECDECGVRFDARQKFSDAPISECPECGGHTHRVPQAVGIVFKGSGWYVTDSKGRNSLATPPKKEDGGEKSSPSSSDGGSEAPAKSGGSSEAAKPDSK
ncbi:FmdB family zinc ribbon protein [Aggregatilinea lenta]|uniref:FmdB family zinc ribbon protein n=1 Tax=Aggregatilinea lenta TaxID=913108 RepID=UPI000E5BFD29|nr:FmdB family zinc ribbon protein [Aggregatilinea lenta]